MLLVGRLHITDVLCSWCLPIEKWVSPISLVQYYLEYNTKPRCELVSQRGFVLSELCTVTMNNQVSGYFQPSPLC